MDGILAALLLVCTAACCTILNACANNGKNPKARNFMLLSQLTRHVEELATELPACKAGGHLAMQIVHQKLPNK